MSEADGPKNVEEAQATLDKHWPGRGLVAVERQMPDGTISYEVWEGKNWEAFKSKAASVIRVARSKV